MGLFVKTDADDIKKYLVNLAQEGCNTTLYHGDERRIFVESVITPIMVALYNVVDDVAKQKMRKYARGEVLDAIGGENCRRLEAEKAKTTLRFFMDEPAAGDIEIPLGTTVATNDGLEFVTVQRAVISIGQLSVDVDAMAAEGGNGYNGIPEGVIAVVVDDISVDGCRNVSVSSGGDDGEPYDTEGDDRYRKRIELYEDSLLSCGTEASYRYYALTSDGTVADAKVVCPEEQGVQSDYDVVIYLICDGGEVPDVSVLEKAQEACSSKEHRPMCEHVNVEPAEQVEYDIEMVVYVAAADHESAPSVIQDAVDAFVARQDTEISKPINPDALMGCVMKAKDGYGNYLDVQRCRIISPSYTELEFNQVGKCSGISISYRIA